MPVPATAISGRRGASAFRVGVLLAKVVLDLQSANLPEILADVAKLIEAIRSGNVKQILAAAESLFAAASTVTDGALQEDIQSLRSAMGFAK